MGYQLSSLCVFGWIIADHLQMTSNVAFHIAKPHIGVHRVIFVTTINHDENITQLQELQSLSQAEMLFAQAKHQEYVD